MIPMGASDPDKVVGESYAGVYLAATRDAVATALAEAAFTGFVGPQEGDWVLAVATNARGTVAAGKRTLDALARDLAGGLGVVAVAVEVDRDKRLRLWAFEAGERIGHFDSAPEDDDDLALGQIPLDEFGDPLPEAMLALGGSGAQSAAELVRVCVSPGASDGEESDPAEELEELLDEELTESESESDRVRSALRLLTLPTWLIASASLPRDVPGGPRAGQVLHLRAGRTGVAGLTLGALSERTRRKFKPDA
ncbi:hypothetical protein [Occultella gossypii]|uniref:Uncharacterized protein n=1 Tax=Occultella gossypii TaxID=2800820 RepID=A0ABS7SFY7_9MICO|nr:hypothetical protein [Occultella gossypii]MBZ2198173.1 hypothetical protein [Occultella gossypii]